MIELQIPGPGTIKLDHAVLDVNGTLAVDGQLMFTADRLKPADREREQTAAYVRTTPFVPCD